ncbi:MAG: hypothetical protein Q9190_000264 [Brigantiaea leucoxantha]
MGLSSLSTCVWLQNPTHFGTKLPLVRDQDPGRVRSVYTEGDSNNFDVIYHDNSKGVSASGRGRQFSMANYHPRVHAADRHHQKAMDYFTVYENHERAASSARSSFEADEHKDAAEDALEVTLT